MTNRTLILFDIDGTLLQAGDRAHSRALLDAFREVFELEPDLDGVVLAGMLDAQIVRQLVAKHGLDPSHTEHRLAQVMQVMGDRYSDATRDVSLQDRVLPGVPEVVSELDNRGHLLGTLTGNARTVGEAKLNLAGLGHLSRIGAFGDSAQHRHELVALAVDAANQLFGQFLSPSNVLLIGDTPKDIQAARDAGARVLAVATGRYDEETLATHDPDAVVPDLRNVDLVVDIAYRLTIGTHAANESEWKAAP